MATLPHRQTMSAEEYFWTYHVFETGDDVELVSLSVRFALAKLYRNVVLPGDVD